MMASIIPRSALGSLKRIAELDDQSFESFISALAQMKPSLRRDELAKAVEETFKAAPRREVIGILNTVFALYGVKDARRASVEEIAEMVDKSVSELVHEESKFPQETRSVLRNRIKRLIAFNKSIAVTAKAADVMTENDRIFCGARILSDIRPVFTDSLESASAAVIIHNLQIGFHDSGTGVHKEFYVALDNQDIQKLKEIILRAEKKTQALKAILNKSSVPYLEV